MSLHQDLVKRAENQCELCASKVNLNIFLVPNAPTKGLDGHALICETCQEQYEHADKVAINHWRCLNDSMWNPNPPVQVLAWRMLHRLRGEGWPVDLLDMMYMEEETAQWAQSTELMDGEEAIIHKDANGNVLAAGDTVTLIQDLNVKGANFTAKRGTAVRRIGLVPDNAEHIEGKINGQHIVILTKYVKKQG
jgi:protein PhnA